MKIIIHKASRGFTLIEVLVALVLVSLLSLLAWRAIDGMGRAGELTNDNEQSLQRIQIGVAQWTADLDAVIDVSTTGAAVAAGSNRISPLDFDGQRLVLTRQSADAAAGVQVVAWTLRTTSAGRVLQRWASSPVTARSGLQAAWDGALRWARTPLPEDDARTVSLMPVSNWQIFYFRGGAWSNPQSAVGASAATTAGSTGAIVISPASLPDGVQLVLDLPSGKLTRYWMLPSLGATK